MILIYGTASSGKSEIAENTAVKIAKENNAPLIYLATMEGETEASRLRIKKHRKQREGKGFYTIEEPYRLIAHVFSVRKKAVLLECVSNYCANVYFNKFGENIASDEELYSLSEEISSDIIKLDESAFEIVVVSNDVFRDGIIYDKWTESYLRLLALVNDKIAKNSDSFIEVINGISYEIK